MKHIIHFLVIILAIASCKPPEARRPVSSSTGTTVNTSIERNKKMIAQQESKIKSLIAKDSLNTYMASADGFWYTYIVKDSTAGQTPQFGDIVNYDYSISDLNDVTIYSEEETPTQTYAMDQEELASGIRQGLQLMKEGETTVLLLPSHKAYGYYGDKNKIGRNLPIQVKLKLNSITTQNKTEE